MIRIALTGGIATGKTYVRRRIETAGVPTIDADQVARDVVAPNTPGLAAVVGRFGHSVLDPNGALDRRALADVVFADSDARRDLEQIIHPAVRTRIDEWLKEQARRSADLAVADIPLLFETDRDRDFDVVIVTACAEGTQRARLQTRDGLSDKDARRRIAAQLPLGEKIARATYVIDTNGTFEDTDRQVDDLLGRLREVTAGA